MLVGDDKADTAKARRRSELKKLRQKTSSSESPTAKPSTSRCPFPLTPVAMTTAFETT